MEKMEKTITIHIRVDRNDWAIFKEIARDKGSHGAVEIRQLIKQYIKENKKVGK